MELSKRLLALTKLVTPGNTVADVGCDHGFVSIYLVKNQISPKVIAMDINIGPLNRAKEHIAEQGLGTYIETRLSDGIDALACGEADTMICAGMGGRLILHILQSHPEKITLMKEFVLQPQSEIWMVRSFLRKNGFQILREDMVKEDGKYYPMMQVRVPEDIKEKFGAWKGEQRELWMIAHMKQLQDKFGPCLMDELHPVLKQYLEKERQKYQEIIFNLKLTNEESPRIMELQQELQDVEEVLELY